MPIAAALPGLRVALASRGVAVLQAPPGAGKTTRVPLALLDEAWLDARKIVMLEPRRLAARAAATFMARLLGERVGETVGYRVRLDTRIGPRTRIEVVTEGVLGRMLQDDPALDGIGLVIFDEFHERSLHADLGLAFALQTRAVLRDDLRILVMSATLEGAPIAALLGDAPVVTSEGRAFPVETRYVARRGDQRIEALVAATVRDVLARERGDVLVFLPGVAEIRRVEAMLEASVLAPDVGVVPLHGSMPLEQQDVAIAASPAGRRKVVLATSIAETSLTIEGVRVVIDSGLMRVPRFAPATGMTRLETRRVSRASADQRRGRAGRTEPGVAYRLWAEHEENHLVAHSAPEILEADLAPLALMLAEAGVTDPANLPWLDQPPAAAFVQARELLVQLGALAAAAGPTITPHGRRMAALPTHPRLSHMVLSAPPELKALACDVAALLGERDVLRRDGGPGDADVRLRLQAVRATGRDATDMVHGTVVDRDAVRRVREQSREWQRQTGATSSAPDDVESAGLLLALAYPDRIAQRRPDGGAGGGTGGVRKAGGVAMPAGPGRFLLRNGRGAVFSSPQTLSVAPWIAVAELDDSRPDARIFLAAPVSLSEIEMHFGRDIVTEDVVEFDPALRAVTARRMTRLGALVIREAPLSEGVRPGEVAAVLLNVLREEGAASLPWTDAARRVRERMGFVFEHEAGWPDVSDAALTATMDEWLGPHLESLRRVDDVRRLELGTLLLGLLDYRQRVAIEEIAPTHVTVPSGSRIAIDYSDPQAPALAVRLQEMFGCTDTPRIARGRVPLTMQLLSPAHRPVQVTRDLANFWKTSYFEVRKDLRGRYPKHHWPDDPLAAEPTNRAKRRT